MPGSHTSATLVEPFGIRGFGATSFVAKVAPGQGFPVRDLVHGGNGRVTGTVKVKGTPDYAVHRRVRLIRERDGVLIREVWSHPTTGVYTFDGVDRTQQYTVISYDHTFNFRAVVADDLTPEVMP